MQIASITVHATWDDEAEVWVASSDDVEGLAVEAPTWKALKPKVVAALGDLIQLNGIRCDLPEIPVRIEAEQRFRVANTTAAHDQPGERVTPDDNDHGAVSDARTEWFKRLERQPIMSVGRWTRNKLYEDEQ